MGAGVGDYREILKTKFAERRRRNSRYSLRAMARDLGLSSSRLSEVLNGRYGISPAAAREIAARLGFSHDETEHFLDLVESRHGRSRAQKTAALARLKRYRRTSYFKMLKEDEFQRIANWYHLAILELSRTKSYRRDPAWIAKRLKIRLGEATEALSRLQRLGYLIRPPRSHRVHSETPSSAIRAFHKQMLFKASEAIEQQDIHQRELGSVVLGIPSARVQEACDRIREFERDFAEMFGGDPGSERIYGLCLQFFELTDSKTEEKTGVRS